LPKKNKRYPCNSKLTSVLKSALAVLEKSFDKIAFKLQHTFADVEEGFYSDFLIWQTFGGHMKV
jgi:hypothetical protein